MTWAARPWSGSPPSAVLVAAHPDDEVIGVGSLLAQFEELLMVHLTDGSPLDMVDARRLGFSKREDYADARRRELDAALAFAGVTLCRCFAMGLADREVSLSMASLATDLLAIFRGARPDVVLTHPYEGGHPDHDAAALCCRLAVDRMAEDPGGAPGLVEFASYHCGPNGEREYGFLRSGDMRTPDGDGAETRVLLDEPGRRLKQSMLDCFVSQRGVLAGFPTDEERFRPAPRYDFTRAPHEGALWYEKFGWTLDGFRWRELAAGACRDFRDADRQCA
jgi:N-acetylglucosamine malate deacetylase 2